MVSVYTKIILLCLAATAAAALAQSTPVPATPTPLPAEVAAEQFQRGAEAWLTVLKDLAYVALPLVGALVAWIYKELQAVKLAHAQNASEIATVKLATAVNAAAISDTPSKSDIDALHTRMNTVSLIASQAGKPAPDSITSYPSSATNSSGIIASALVAVLFFTGCSTVTPQEKQDAWNEVYKAALAAGTAALTGEKGQAVAQAAFAAATTGQPVQQLITDAVTTNGGTVPQANQINAAVASALAISKASTPAQKVVALNTIGSALQLVANQEFAK